MQRRYRYTATERDRGRRLADVVADWLPEAVGRALTRTALRRLVMAGAIRVDGRSQRRPGAPIVPGSRLEASVRLDLLARHALARDRPFVLDRRAILYEDDVLIVVDKPPGLPTQPTVDSARPHLFGAVKRYLEARGRPSYLGMHQRLDRDTSGVVVFTTDPRANAGLAVQFEQRGLEKTYLALTRRPLRLPPASWRASSPLTAGHGPRVRSGAGGAAAETAFRRVETLQHALLVEARPRTGRKHQVRVHLADGGLPILGDDVYGTPSSDPTRVPRLMLHAWRLDFRHPLTAAALALESPLPADFASALASLRRA